MKYTKWLKNIKGYSDRTIEVYAKVAFELESLGGDWEKLIERKEGKSSSTRRLVLSACKSYYTFTKDIRSMDIELPKKEIKVSDYVSFDDYKTYLESINIKTKMGYQKYIIIRLLFETGMRSNELLWITKTNIRGNRIKIKGKGSKERFIMISEWLRTDLERYIKTIKTERIFCFGYKNLYSKIKRLDNERVLTPHMFRHGYAKYCFEKGISIYDISISMGHSSVDTTAKYINKRSEDVAIYKIF